MSTHHPAATTPHAASSSTQAAGLSRLALRIFWRYRLRMLFFAGTIAIGVAFLIALGSLLDSINSSITRQARSLMAADISIASGYPLPQKTEDFLRSLKEKNEFISSKMLIFPSMLAPDQMPTLAPPTTQQTTTSTTQQAVAPTTQQIATSTTQQAVAPTTQATTKTVAPTKQAATSAVAKGEKQEASPAESKGFTTPILVSVKAIEEAYPFYGELETTPKAWREGFFRRDACLLDRALADQHGLRLGAWVRLGRARFQVVGIIEQEPDQLSGGGFANLAPRVMIPYTTVEKTGLLRFGSRVSYRTLLKAIEGQKADIRRIGAIKTALSAQLTLPNTQVTAYTEAQPTIRDILQRIGIFFIFVSLVALLLGAIGMAASVTTFLNEQMETVGILRCMGLGPRDIAVLYTRLCVGIGVIGGLVGVAVGALLNWVGLGVVSQIMEIPLQFSLHWSFFLEGIGLACLLTWGLNAAAVRSLAALSPQAILSGRQAEIPLSRSALAWTGIFLLIGFFLYAARAALSWQVGGFFTLTLGAMIALCLLLILLALALFQRISQSLQRSTPVIFILRHGLRQLIRQRARSLTYLLALTVGVSLIATLQMVQQSLEAEIQIARYNKLPNLFLIDVQREQIQGVQSMIERFGAKSPELSPLVRARLTHINGKAIQRKDLKGASLESRMRAGFLRREYNLTYKARLNPSESVIAGRFWPPNTRAAEISLEKSWASRLGLVLGDTLRFDILGRPIEGKITSIRTINWRSFLPNFFVVMPPHLLQDAPQQLITSISLYPTEKIAPFQRALVQAYPNVSVIDLGRVITLMRRILGAFISAMQGLAWMCLIIGLLILAGTLGMGQRERKEKVALMRALGAQYRTLVAVDIVEFLTIGLITAFVVIAVSWGTGAIIAYQMEIAFQITLSQIALIFLAAILLPFTVGMIVNARTYRAGVLDNLRHPE